MTFSFRLQLYETAIPRPEQKDISLIHVPPSIHPEDLLSPVIINNTDIQAYPNYDTEGIDANFTFTVGLEGFAPEFCANIAYRVFQLCGKGPYGLAAVKLPEEHDTPYFRQEFKRILKMLEHEATRFNHGDPTSDLSKKYKSIYLLTMQ